MSTTVCLRMCSLKGLSNITNNGSRLLSITSIWSPNVSLQVSEYPRLLQQFPPVRNICLSSTRFKEVFKRDKPHLNIGKIYVIIRLRSIKHKIA